MSKGESTRNTILDEALARTSELGFEGLSIGALADRVGMSKSGLFAHFRSKQDLQLQVLESAVEQFGTEVVAPAFAAPRGEPRIRALFENWLTWSQSTRFPGGCVFLAVAAEQDDRPGPLRDRLVGFEQRWLSGLATSARMAIEEGHFRADLDVHQFAHEYFSIILACHHFTRLIRDAGAIDRSRQQFERLLQDARG